MVRRAVRLTASRISVMAIACARRVCRRNGSRKRSSKVDTSLEYFPQCHYGRDCSKLRAGRLSTAARCPPIVGGGINCYISNHSWRSVPTAKLLGISCDDCIGGAIYLLLAAHIHRLGDGQSSLLLSSWPQQLLTSYLGEPGSIPGRVTADFRKWESCRTMLLVGGYSRDLQFPPSLHSGTAPFSPPHKLSRSRRKSRPNIYPILSAFSMTLPYHSSIQFHLILLEKPEPSVRNFLEHPESSHIQQLSPRMITRFPQRLSTLTRSRCLHSFAAVSDRFVCYRFSPSISFHGSTPLSQPSHLPDGYHKLLALRIRPLIPPENGWGVTPDPVSCRISLHYVQHPGPLWEGAGLGDPAPTAMRLATGGTIHHAGGSVRICSCLITVAPWNDAIHQRGLGARWSGYMLHARASSLPSRRHLDSGRHQRFLHFTLQTRRIVGTSISNACAVVRYDSRNLRADSPVHVDALPRMQCCPWRTLPASPVMWEMCILITQQTQPVSKVSAKCRQSVVPTPVLSATVASMPEDSHLTMALFLYIMPSQARHRNDIQAQHCQPPVSGCFRHKTVGRYRLAGALSSCDWLACFRTVVGFACTAKLVGSVFSAIKADWRSDGTTQLIAQHLQIQQVGRPGVERRIYNLIDIPLARALATRLSQYCGRSGTGEIPEKTRRPTESSGTIPTCEYPVARPAIEPGSPWWEASVLVAQSSCEGERYCQQENKATAGDRSNDKSANTSSISAENPETITWRAPPSFPQPLLINSTIPGSDGVQGRGKRDIPEKTRRPVVGIVRHDSHMRNSRSTSQGIESGLPRWEVNSLTIIPPRLLTEKVLLRAAPLPPPPNRHQVRWGRLVTTTCPPLRYLTGGMNDSYLSLGHRPPILLLEKSAVGYWMKVLGRRHCKYPRSWITGSFCGSHLAEEQQSGIVSCSVGHQWRGWKTADEAANFVRREEHRPGKRFATRLDYGSAEMRCPEGYCHVSTATTAMTDTLSSGMPLSVSLVPRPQSMTSQSSGQAFDSLGGADDSPRTLSWSGSREMASASSERPCELAPSLGAMNQAQEIE
ncbi:hypothetical protein PR048_019688 [Dryococelus australis]|uniref:Uncharacterized protein n=1 Tax=Dryococelus australis TaxID=614101 RepID=A0ABQ9H482_9NEOP|nr:hypothetical protein PR048_019688 [Dryococelus australis]